MKSENMEVSCDNANAAEATGKGSDKLSLVARIGYGMGEAGSQCSWALVSGYLTLFYTDVVGLMPIAISAILMIARVWDAVNDPMFGAIAENKTFKKLGRYRGWILVGTPFLALFNCLTFLNLDIADPLKTIYCGVTYIACGMAYTVVNISTGALANNMTTNPMERSSLAAWRGTLGNVVSFILNLVTMPVILFFGKGSTSSPRGYFLSALMFSIVSIPFFLFCVATTKEVVFDRGSRKEKQKKNILKDFWKSLKVTFADHDIRMLILANIFILIGIFGRFGIISYYFIYVVGDPLSMTYGMSSMTIGSTIAYVIAPAVIKRFDKRVVAVFSSVTVGLSFIGFFIVGQMGSTILVVGVSFLMGLLNMTQPAMYSITGDLIDDNWLRTGKRTEGMTYSMISFATKFGNAVGGSVGVLLLSAVGYVANSDMDTATLTKINAIVNLLPIILIVLGGICFARIRMTNKQAFENEVKIKQLNQENKSE